MTNYPSAVVYSEKYFDQFYEYRHVVLTREMARNVGKARLLSEQEWRALGVQQSYGWQHYALHKPEPHILLFRRPLGTNIQTGEAPAGFIDPY